jgi:hypothetical protein
MGWSLSKVMRIESGDVTISTTDLGALLRLLEVGNTETVQRMVTDARAARRRERVWWNEPQFREHIRPNILQMLQFESEATAIRTFNYAVLPTLMQADEYAEAIVDAAGSVPSGAARSALLELGRQRRRHFSERPDRPSLLVILDELLLLRTPGSRIAMSRQWHELAEMAARPNVKIRLLPKESSAHLLVGSFSIFNSAHDDAVLYREFSFDSDVIHAADTVEEYRLQFDQMWDSCLPETATNSMIEATSTMLMTSILRHEGR